MASRARAMASPSPLLVIISGPSGAGKDTVLLALKQLESSWHFPITATTRSPRGSEVDGVDYIFMSQSQYAELLARDGFLEHAEVYGHRYGVPRQQVSDALASGQTVVLKVDIQGTATIKGLAPEAVSIMIEPSSVEELRGRLVSRGTEDGPVMEKRLKSAAAELERTDLFDHRVLNADGKLDEAVASVEAIIEAEQHRIPPRQVSL